MLRQLLSLLLVGLGSTTVVAQEANSPRRNPVALSCCRRGRSKDRRCRCSRTRLATGALGLLKGGGPILLGERTALQWGGPETRTRCVNWATGDWPWGVSWKTCVGWATDFLRYVYVVRMYGPADMDPKQIDGIKDSCNVTAITSQLFLYPLAVDTVVSLFVDSRPAMEASMRACLATTTALGKLVESDFRLELEKREFWPPSMALLRARAKEA